MTTYHSQSYPNSHYVVEAYRLDRYDNFLVSHDHGGRCVVEAYRLDRYDNFDYQFLPRN